MKVYAFEEYPKKIMVLGRRVTVNSKAEEGLLHSTKNKATPVKKAEIIIPEIVPEIIPEIAEDIVSAPPIDSTQTAP